MKFSWRLAPESEALLHPERKLAGVLIVVHRWDGKSPDEFRYMLPVKVRVDVSGGDLVIGRRLGRVLERYRSGEWTGYEVRKLYGL